MKNKKNKLSLSSLLFEQDENETIPTDISAKVTQGPQNYSLDQKVDHFLIQYEREANPQEAMFADDVGLNSAMTTKSSTSGVGAGFGGGQSAVATPVAMEKGLGENRRNKNSLKALLWEADDPAAGGAPDPTGGAAPDLGGGGGGLDALGGGDIGGDDGGGQPQLDVPKPQINLSIFANKLARLINNFDSLVNPKMIVLNRAYTYIRQNYDENTAKELLVLLEMNYNLSNTTLGDKERMLVGQVPFAVGAGDGGSGGGGGA